LKAIELMEYKPMNEEMQQGKEGTVIKNTEGTFVT
jgi:hypothetical protein